MSIVKIVTKGISILLNLKHLVPVLYTRLKLTSIEVHLVFHFGIVLYIYIYIFLNLSKRTTQRHKTKYVSVFQEESVLASNSVMASRGSHVGMVCFG